MKRIFAFAVTMFVFGGFFSSAQEHRKYQMDYNGGVRTYSMYIPEGLKYDSPVVIYAHDSGDVSPWRESLNNAADRHRFAVCYPDGTLDNDGKPGWNVGCPSQSEMDKHEEVFLFALVQELLGRFDFSYDDVFLVGMSNGGDLCYRLAYTAPNLFRAYASVAGRAYEWWYDAYKLKFPVHFLEIHGNGDKVSLWEGDSGNIGGRGRYLSVSDAVRTIAKSNGATETKVEPVESASGRKITRTVYSGSPSGRKAVLYEIDGGEHCWPDQDLDLGEVIWQFFAETMLFEDDD